QDGPDIAEPAEPGTAEPDGPGTAERDAPGTGHPGEPDTAEPHGPGTAEQAWPRTADARVNVPRTAAHGPMTSPAWAHSHALQGAHAPRWLADRTAANLSPAGRVPRAPRLHVVPRSHGLPRRCAPHRAPRKAPRHAR